MRGGVEVCKLQGSYYTLQSVLTSLEIIEMLLHCSGQPNASVLQHVYSAMSFSSFSLSLI